MHFSKFNLENNLSQSLRINCNNHALYYQADQTSLTCVAPIFSFSGNSSSILLASISAAVTSAGMSFGVEFTRKNMGTTAAHIRPKVTQLIVSDTKARREMCNVQSDQGSGLDLSVHTVSDRLTNRFQRSESSSIPDIRCSSAQLLRK